MDRGDEDLAGGHRLCQCRRLRRNAGLADRKFHPATADVVAQLSSEGPSRIRCARTRDHSHVAVWHRAAGRRFAQDFVRTKTRNAQGASSGGLAERLRRTRPFKTPLRALGMQSIRTAIVSLQRVPARVLPSTKRPMVTMSVSGIVQATRSNTSIVPRYSPQEPMT